MRNSFDINIAVSDCAAYLAFEKNTYESLNNKHTCIFLSCHFTMWQAPQITYFPSFFVVEKVLTCWLMYQSSKIVFQVYKAPNVQKAIGPTLVHTRTCASQRSRHWRDGFCAMGGFSYYILFVTAKIEQLLCTCHTGFKIWNHSAWRIWIEMPCIYKQQYLYWEQQIREFCCCCIFTQLKLECYNIHPQRSSIVWCFSWCMPLLDSGGVENFNVLLFRCVPGEVTIFLLVCWVWYFRRHGL